MRMHIIPINAAPASTPIDAERGRMNSSTFRGTWRKPTSKDKPNAHAYRGRPLFILSKFFPPPSFLNVPNK